MANWRGKFVSIDTDNEKALFIQQLSSACDKQVYFVYARACTVSAWHCVFDERNFIQIDTPNTSQQSCCQKQNKINRLDQMRTLMKEKNNNNNNNN